MRKWVVSVVLLLGSWVVSSVVVAATCPAPDSKSIVKVGDNYQATIDLDTKTSIQLMTDHERKGPPKQFDTMIISPESPYFISCGYDHADLVLKTLKDHFLDTEKNCTLKGAKPGDVQVTSVATICKSNRVADCQLVCE